MKYQKTLINPDTAKEWRIELDGQMIKTCLNNGKSKETAFKDDFTAEQKASQAIMEKLRKGFLCQNPDAAFGEATCHQFVGRNSNGFMPIAASTARDDFYITRIIGDFEDEMLWHFDENGNVLDKVSLGPKRMTYSQALCADNTILMNNSHLIEQFSVESGEIVPFANQRNSLKSMLDSQNELALWYTGEEIVVFDFADNRKIWSEKAECQRTGKPFKTYYCEGMLSPQQTRAVYRTEEKGYVLVDLKTAEKILIENSGWHPFFSPDDRYFSVGGRFYVCETGTEVPNPFPFEISPSLTFYDTCTVKTNGRLIALRQGNRRLGAIELWDYVSGKLLTRIEDTLAVKNLSFAFTRSNLVLHTDSGVVSIYNCSI